MFQVHTQDILTKYNNLQKLNEDKLTANRIVYRSVKWDWVDTLRRPRDNIAKSSLE